MIDFMSQTSDNNKRIAKNTQFPLLSYALYDSSIIFH